MGMAARYRQLHLNTQVTGANGNSTQYTFPVTGSTFSDMFPAPGVPGTYTVTTTFNPAPGSTLAGSTSAPSTLTVGPASATVTETVNPNPAGAGAPVTVSGTVTNADGSPGTGTVQLYVSSLRLHFSRIWVPQPNDLAFQRISYLFTVPCLYLSTHS